MYKLLLHNAYTCMYNNNNNNNNTCITAHVHVCI